MSDRAMGNTSEADAKAATSDLQLFGNTDAWVLICKASSQTQEWMRSTKALEVPGGCFLQVSTITGRHLAEAVTFAPGVTVAHLLAASGIDTGRSPR